MRKSDPKLWLYRALCACAGGLCFCILAARTPAADVEAPPKEYEPSKDEFSSVQQAVLELLQGRDAARFANKLAATIEDYRAILSEHPVVPSEAPLTGMQQAANHERQKVEATARAVLARAEALHLDFSGSNLSARVILPKHFGSTHWDNLQAKGESVPWAEKVEIVLQPASAPKNSPNGEFKVALLGMLRFPGGWRSYDGIQWVSFPANVADERTLREVALLQRTASNEGFTDKEDPALLKLGEALVRFIRERDAAIFEKQALITSDLAWAQFQKSGQKGPSRHEFDEEMSLRSREQLDKARAAVKLMEDAGVALKDAEIRIEGAAVERCQSLGASGPADALMGHQFTLTLAVKTAHPSKSGAALSGQYIFAANEIMRFGDEWRVMENAHWYQLPEGILDEKTVAAMELENYVAAHGSLPPGKPAPEIEFTSLTGEKKMKLSDLRGKVVVLDFWATWCGPCQGPMAELQKIRTDHPAWQDRVAIVPLSIDDTIKIVRAHVDKRGWTNTFNVWAGDGGWRSTPAKAFRVTGVPTTYIIDAQGKIITAGHPASLPIAQTVDRLLVGAKNSP